MQMEEQKRLVVAENRIEEEDNPPTMNESPGNSSKTLESSTESEAFDTWTLVSEPSGKSSNMGGETETQEATSAVEDIENADDSNAKNSDIDQNTDNELSDGISIISDSEETGGGRLSPLHGHSLKKLCSLIDEQQADENNKFFHPLTPPVTPRNMQIEQSTITSPVAIQQEDRQNRVRQFFWRFPAVFYVSLIVLAVALLNRSKTPAPEFTEDHLTSPKLSTLTQRMENLETDNSILRSEINRLAEKLKLLSFPKETDTRDPVHRRKEFEEDLNRLEKQMKNENRRINVWLGGANEEHPIKIPSKHFQLPKYCHENQDAWISEYDAELCNQFLEKLANNDFQKRKIRNQVKLSEETGKNSRNIEDSDSQKTETVLKKEALKEVTQNFEENLVSNDGQPPFKYMFGQPSHPKKYETKDKDTKSDDGNMPLEKNILEEEDYKNSGEKYSGKRSHEFSKKQYHKEKYPKIYSPDDSSEQSYENGANSRERFDHRKQKSNKKNRADHSGERQDWEKRREFNEYDKIKSSFNIDGRKYDARHGDTGDNSGDNDWHEKLMKHREESRRNSGEKIVNKNWFFERGSGRRAAPPVKYQDRKHEEKQRRKLPFGNVFNRIRRIGSYIKMAKEFFKKNSS